MYSFIEKRLSGVRIHFNSTSTNHETIWYTIIEVINIWVSQNSRCWKRSLRPNWYPCVLVPFCDHSCVLHLLLFRCCLECCGSFFFFLISVLFTKVVHSVRLWFYHKFAADDQTKRLLYIAVEQWKQWIGMINERCLCCSAPATENHLSPAIITPLATIPMSS